MIVTKWLILHKILVLFTASEITLRAVPPDFSKVWVQDMFRSLGPLPIFSAENKWGPPRTVTLKRGRDGFGFMIRNSRPVVFSGVDKGGPADVSQMSSIMSIALHCCLSVK